MLRLLNKLYNKAFPTERSAKIKPDYFGKKIATSEEGNELIKKLLLNGQPFMVARIGSTELFTLTNYLEIAYFKNNPNSITGYWKQVKNWSPVWQNKTREMIHNFSGVFPTDDDSLNRFSKIYLDGISEIDALGAWYNYNEDAIYQQYCPNASLIPLPSIEPYYFEDPWSKLLEGKKVLAIHPFEKSIKHQYEHRKFLFPNDKVYPDFELKTIKAVQSIAKNDTDFKNWFDALDAMKAQIDQQDFDVAIIGAGAYGLPLAAHVKKIGKQAIHMGGATQIMFGVRGSRWDSNPVISKFYNEHWIRPLPEETPQSFKSVENGCYW